VRVFDVSIKFLTPAIISTKRGYRGMLYLGSSNKIPGSTIRGALMTWALREELVSKNELDDEVLDPKYGITPFIATNEKLRMYHDLQIAHALAFKFKDGLGEPRVYSIGIKELLEEVRQRQGAGIVDALSELIARVSTAIDLRGNELLSSSNIEDVTGQPVRLEGSAWKICDNVSQGLYIGTGIDRSRRSVVPGVLFGYEYVRPGSTYAGIIACEENSIMFEIIKELMRLSGKAKVSIGKGVGRGYGVASIHVREAEAIQVSSKVRGSNYIALEVIGPTAMQPPLDSNQLPIPRPIFPSDSLNICRDGKCLKLSIKAVYGGETTVGGWSLRTSSPKLSFSALSHGSIVIAEVDGDLGVLDLIPYLGINNLASQGYNILLPLIEDFLPRYGG